MHRKSTHLDAKDRAAEGKIGLREKIVHRVLPGKIVGRDLVAGLAVALAENGADRVPKVDGLPKVAVTIAAKADGPVAADRSSNRRKSRSRS
jgi:hypothetical protein